MGARILPRPMVGEKLVHSRIVRSLPAGEFVGVKISCAAEILSGHFRQTGRISCKFNDALRQTLYVITADEGVRWEDLREAAYITADTGQSAGHGFENGTRESLLTRRQDEEVRTIQNLLNSRSAPQLPQKLDTTLQKRVPCCESFNAWTIYSIPDKAEMRVQASFDHPCEGLYQNILRFLEKIK